MDKFNSWLKAEKFNCAPGKGPSPLCWFIWVIIFSSNLMLPIYAMLDENTRSDPNSAIGKVTGEQLCEMNSTKKFLFLFVTFLGGLVQVISFGNHCNKCAGSTLSGFGGLVAASAVTNLLQLMILNYV